MIYSKYIRAIIPIVLIIASLLLFSILIVPHKKPPPTVKDYYARVMRIYHNLYVHTGRAGDIPPIYIVKSGEINAYATNDGIVIYTAMLEAVKNDDELALVIGHEMSHVTLGHLNMTIKTDDDQSVLESMADKMGAFYMMASGYDICKGREFWKRMRMDEGDYMNRDHPDMSYRYDQLNVGCD